MLKGCPQYSQLQTFPVVKIIQKAHNTNVQLNELERNTQLKQQGSRRGLPQPPGVSVCPLQMTKSPSQTRALKASLQFHHLRRRRERDGGVCLFGGSHTCRHRVCGLSALAPSTQITAALFPQLPGRRCAYFCRAGGEEQNRGARGVPWTRCGCPGTVPRTRWALNAGSTCPPCRGPGSPLRLLPNLLSSPLTPAQSGLFPPTLRSQGQSCLSFTLPAVHAAPLLGGCSGSFQEQDPAHPGDPSLCPPSSQDLPPQDGAAADAGRDLPTSQWERSHLYSRGWRRLRLFISSRKLRQEEGTWKQEPDGCGEVGGLGRGTQRSCLLGEGHWQAGQGLDSQPGASVPLTLMSCPLKGQLFVPTAVSTVFSQSARWV